MRKIYNESHANSSCIFKLTFVKVSIIKEEKKVLRVGLNVDKKAPVTVPLRGSIEVPQKLKTDYVNDLAILLRNIYPQVYRKIILNVFFNKREIHPFLPSSPLYLFQFLSQTDRLFILIIATYTYIYVCKII